VDPRTGEHVGQVLLDFFSDSIFQALNDDRRSNGQFPILIAVQGEERKNAVVAPGFSLGDDAKEISEVVLEYDDCNEEKCADNLAGFDAIVESMKKGEAGSTNFTRTTSDGGMETIFIAYTPVVVKTNRPLDSSDFASGVKVSEYLIYSLGLCTTEKSLFKPFEEIENDVAMQINMSTAILSFGIILAVLFIVKISYIVTSSITEPILYLLELIRCINR
jgi:hypothetical protein